MKVLVTGASGFVGGHLVAYLRAAGFHVRAAGRRRCVPEGVEWADLADVTTADWRALCAGMDTVVHLAAIAHTRGVPPERLRAVNQDAAIALARAMSPDQQLIFMSSIRAVAGPGSPVPITEETEPRPACDYGRAKQAAEAAIQRIRPDACVLRPVTVYGLGAKHNMGRLRDLAHSSLPLPAGSLTARRSYLSVENLCSAVAFVVANRTAGLFTLADPDVASVRDLLAWHREAIGAPRRLFSLPGDPVSALVRLPRVGPFLRILAEPLVARPDKLLAAGWRPVHSSTRDGIRHWALNETADVKAA